jgi:hypothetical protein
MKINENHSLRMQPRAKTPFLDLNEILQMINLFKPRLLKIQKWKPALEWSKYLDEKIDN